MERQDLTAPFDVHLQWFADPPVEPAPGEGGPRPEPQPAPEPEPKPLSAEGTWLSQASDKYKRDPKVLQDLLQGERACKSWSDVLGRMYAAEQQAGEHKAAVDELTAKLTTAEARAAQLEEAAKQKVAPPPAYKPEDYQAIKPAELPAWMQAPEYEQYSDDLRAYLADAAKEIAKVAQELGITPTAAQRFAELFTQRHVDAVKAAEDEQHRQREAGLEALKKTWKGDFAANEDLARRALATFGGLPLAHLLAARGLGNDPAVIATFLRIGKAIGEGELVPGTPGPTVPGPGSKQAQMRKRYDRSPELHSQGA